MATQAHAWEQSQPPFAWLWPDAKVPPGVIPGVLCYWRWLGLSHSVKARCRSSFCISRLMCTTIPMARVGRWSVKFMWRHPWSRRAFYLWYLFGCLAMQKGQHGQVWWFQWASPFRNLSDVWIFVAAGQFYRL